MKKVKIAVIGAGCRGMYAYAPYLLENPHLGEVVAVAEINEEKRKLFKEKYNIKDENIFSNYKEMLDKEKLADAVIIANQDEDHYTPAKLALEKGYHILLEKPMSNKLDEVVKLGELAKQYSSQIFMVCHVLRYTPFFTELKKIVDSKELGELITIQHNENIGYWHFAHSYVRGNWRNSEETSPLILAKSCHDLDILLWLTGKRCTHIASFGSLSNFKTDNYLENMSEMCVDCKVEETCPYSAKKIYLRDNKIESSLNAVHTNPTKENLREAIKTSPYGRCVYNCDNNVVDHQVTILEFEGGITATFNLSAFTKECTRTIKLMFSHGEVRGNHIRNEIDIHKFGEDKHTVIYPKVEKSGHGGGDYSLFKDFISVVSNSSGEMKTEASKSVESHVMAFKAEEARLKHTVIKLN